MRRIKAVVVAVSPTRPLAHSLTAGLQSLGYHGLWPSNATLDRLRHLLDHDWPVIVFLRAADLPHGRSGLHAVVVIGIESQSVICQEPSLRNGD